MKKLLFIAALAWTTVGVVVSAGQATRNSAPAPRAASASIVPPASARAAQAQSAARPAPPVATAVEAKQLVDRFCVGCHNERTSTPAANPLRLDSVNYANPAGDSQTWERVVRKLAVGAMPPQGVPHPEPAALNAFAEFLITNLDRAAVARNNPGRYVAHRLNRTEYANAVRDLVGVEFDAAALLPSDGGDFGFDNIAASLKTSPLLLERYLSAALRVSAMAVGDATVTPGTTTYSISTEHSQKEHIEGLPLGTRGGALVRHNFPADGEYQLSARPLRGVEEGYVGVEGWERPNDFVITIDGEQVYTSPVGGEVDHSVSTRSVNESKVILDGRLTTRVFVTAGTHDVGFTWVDRTAQEQAVWQPSLRDSQEVHMVAGFPRLRRMNIEGPYNVTGISDTPSRRRIFVCRPSSSAEDAPCAQRIFLTLARHAFRRPVAPSDVEAPLAFYNEARRNGGDFDAGIRTGVARILVSPSFLYRVEYDPTSLPAGSAHPVSDLELASRLSFFLWNSIPDDQLLNLASAGGLRRPGVLAAQVMRMIADARADSMMASFTGQWLQLRSLESKVAPDLLLFPHFDDNVRKAFRRETELFFANAVRDNLSVLDLLTANYTFANERLARHYGLKGVYGERFRRVEVTEPNRRGLGLLGHGSLLSVTSVATRTSPVIRGKFILTTLMGLPAPVPPPNVPALDQSAPARRPTSVRERMESHRRNPVCASCHRNIDPLGFSLENFDAVGQWRDTTEDGKPVDTASVLQDGTAVNGPAALRNWLVGHPAVFAGNVTERMLIYALGRGLEPSDMGVVRGIVRNAARDNYRFMSVIIGIVESKPFQMRVKPALVEGLQANRGL
jgi:mono/diheme cytochrome c family protein